MEQLYSIDKAKSDESRTGFVSMDRQLAPASTTIAYRPRDRVRSFIALPFIPATLTTSFQSSLYKDNSRVYNSVWLLKGGGARGYVDRGYRGVSADCRRPINAADGVPQIESTL